MVFHTTGSGKTLTSFKAARLATELDYIDKVFFVVDRKDLDYQTMKEYQRFSPDSVNGSENTAGLKRNIEKDDNKIIVTTIQKMNNLIKAEANLEIYNKQVVFIFDEAHRSQFGEAQKNIKKKFKKYYQFGFTGTPIFPENALGAETTASVFGRELHSYVITDAIRDAPTLNTLFVDKNLRYHGLMQAFSRTNRIYDSTKTFGNIVTFRDLEQATIDAIKCFGDDNTKNIVLEKSYQEYMNGFKDIVTGEARRGYVEVVSELKSRFADVDEITTEKEKKEFVKLFGEYLKIENILQNYDEFTNLKELQKIDLSDLEAIEAFKSTHFVSDEDIKAMQSVDILEERTIQDYRSTYNDIREWIRREREGKEKDNSKIDWDDVVFEVDLLKSQEINLDYILELIYEKNKNTKDKNTLIDEIRRIIRSSTGNRAKESLIIDFINQTDLDEIQDKSLCRW